MTQEQTNTWTRIDGNTGDLLPVDSDKLSFPDMDEDDIAGLQDVQGFAIVNTREVWTKCPATGELDQLVLRDMAYRPMKEEEVTILKTHLQAGEVALNVLNSFYD